MPMEILFPGVAVVTGAAGTGIGAAIAKAFVTSGCTRIAITDLNASQLLNTKTSILTTYPAISILSLPGDISSESFVNRFIDAVVQEFGRVDYCVNCAGVLGSGKTSSEMSVEEFDSINSVNYRGCWLSSRAQIRAMLLQDPLPGLDAGRPGERGSIVNIASQLGIVARRSAPAYCASKAAVISMTRADAIDNSVHNIRINAICPGLIATPMTTDSNGVGLERMKPDIAVAPMNRMGTVEEVADCALFLVSSRASFVQGSAMVVDGGYIIN